MSIDVADHGPGGSAKWGEAARAGFQPVPDALFVKQQELGLDSTDMLVVLNLTSYWWFKDRPPFARTNVIADRMGVTPRTVQRSLKKLEKKGYIHREQYEIEDGSLVPALRLDGLVEKLSVLAVNDSTLAARIARANEQELSRRDDIPF